MLRKLVTAIIGVSALIPGAVFGLGLGQVELNSFLNQPLDAKIELLQTRDLTPEEVIAGLANSKEFAAAGVDRSFFLSLLKFDIEQANGKTYLRVTSKRPVTEPFLNFLVDIQWPSGRLLREYTVLLNPPEFKDELPLAIRSSELESARRPDPRAIAPTAPAKAKSGVVRSDQKSDEVLVKGASGVTQSPGTTPDGMISDKPLDTKMAAPKAQARPSIGSSVAQKPMAQSYTVVRGDTLSGIVSKTLESKTSLPQVLIAYKYLNPDAFIDNNVNLVKSGAVLQIPTEDDIRQVSRAEAIQEIAAQNKAWRSKLQARVAKSNESLAGRQLDGTGRELMPTKTPVKTDEGRLRIVTPGADASVDSGASGRGGASAAETLSALKDQLALETEKVEKFSIANEGLVGELQELNSIIEKTDRILSLKDDQIAAFQQQLRMLEEQSAMFAESAAMGTTNPYSVESVMNDMDELPADLVEEVPEVAVIKEEPMQEFDEAIAEPERSSSFFSHPLFLGAAGAVVLAILGVLWARSRRQDDEDEDEDEDEGEDFEFDESFEAVDRDVEEPDSDDESEQQYSTKKLDKQLLEAVDEFDIDTVLSEADIYVAYGHFPKAIAMLTGGLKEAPNSVGLNMKLLEVYAESRDSDAFVKLEKHVRTLTTDNQFLGKINAMRTDLGLTPGKGPAESFNDEETQFLGEDTSVPSTPFEDEDFLSLADIEAELDVGGQTSDEARFVPEDTQVNAELELDLSGSNFNFEETNVPDEDLAFETNLDSFSPNDALADIDEEIGNLNEDLDAMETDLGLISKVPPQDVNNIDIELEGELELESDLNLDLDEDLVLDEGFTLDEGTVDDVPDAVLHTRSVTPLNQEDASLLDGVDEIGTKLDLATAYFEMGDNEGAKDILEEVLLEGNDNQQESAKNLLAKIG